MTDAELRRLEKRIDALAKSQNFVTVAYKDGTTRRMTWLDCAMELLGGPDEPIGHADEILSINGENTKILQSLREEPK
ncbi:MAG: hypothetical protein LUB63_06860 [Oscillospiraceae bacterium]|nr:hypothetical protein [Oscillospiraceae bacterium]